MEHDGRSGVEHHCHSHVSKTTGCHVLVDALNSYANESAPISSSGMRNASVLVHGRHHYSDQQNEATHMRRCKFNPARNAGSGYEASRLGRMMENYQAAQEKNVLETIVDLLI